jgi:hypothetical protein
MLSQLPLAVGAGVCVLAAVKVGADVLVEGGVGLPAWGVAVADGEGAAKGVLETVTGELSTWVEGSSKETEGEAFSEAAFPQAARMHKPKSQPNTQHLFRKVAAATLIRRLFSNKV